MSCKVSVNLFTKKKRLGIIIISSGIKWSKVGGLLFCGKLVNTLGNSKDLKP